MEFAGGVVVRTEPSYTHRGVGSIPGQGTNIPQASRPRNQNIKQKQYLNQFYEKFENGSDQKFKKKTVCKQKVNTFPVY